MSLWHNISPSVNCSRELSKVLSINYILSYGPNINMGLSSNSVEFLFLPYKYQNVSFKLLNSKYYDRLTLLFSCPLRPACPLNSISPYASVGWVVVWVSTCHSSWFSSGWEDLHFPHWHISDWGLALKVLHSLLLILDLINCIWNERW